MANEKWARSLYELGSDFLREAAVLVIVFGLLEKMTEELPIQPFYVLQIVAVSGVLFMVGFLLERLRTR